MPQFFFDRHESGTLIEDHIGLSFSDERAACLHAFRLVAAAIGQITDPTNTYLGVEVKEGSRTQCIVRASIVFEHYNSAQGTT